LAFQEGICPMELVSSVVHQAQYSVGTGGAPSGLRLTSWSVMRATQFLVQR